MKEYQSFAHTRWDCKYHVVFIPKKRKKRIFGVLRKHLGEIFHELAVHKEAKIVEGHIMADHVHMCISIPPKYAVSNVMGYIKGKSAITIARRFGGRVKNFTGEVVALILLLLVADICSDYLFIKPNRRNKIPSSPENLASEILYSTPKAPPRNMRYRM